MLLTARAVLIGASLTIAATAAAAQTLPGAQSRSLAPSSDAAATLPNSFDGPAARPVPEAPLPDAPGGTAAAAQQLAEDALVTVIGQLKAGQVEPALYTADLATRLRGQLPTLRPKLESFGEIVDVEAQGSSDGAGQFLVTFDTTATQWLIGIDGEGRIAALLFREAPPESSEPPTPPAPATTRPAATAPATR